MILSLWLSAFSGLTQAPMVDAFVAIAMPTFFGTMICKHLIDNGSVTPIFYNIRVSIMHNKNRGKLNKSVGSVAFFQGIVALFRE